MSRPERLHGLREQTPAAPAALRERVRALAAASAPPPRRRPGLRLPLAGLALVSLAAAAIALVAPRLRPEPEAALGALASLAPVHVPAAQRPSGLRVFNASGGAASAAAATAPSSAAALPGAISPAPLPGPSATRAQRYGATLRLRLPDGSAVAAAARRAVAIVQSLGGYEQTLEVSVSASSGTASLVLELPRARVAAAIDRLSALGSVVGEHVSISDLQSGIDALGRRIIRLERRLAAALHAPQSAANERLAAALSAQIEGLQQARTRSQRAAQDATVKLLITTPARRHVAPPRKRPQHGPFHALGADFRLAGIVIVYVLALGAPLALLAALAYLLGRRAVRRREQRLLSRS